MCLCEVHTFSFALPACFCTVFAINAPLLSAIFFRLLKKRRLRNPSPQNTKFNFAARLTLLASTPYHGQNARTEARRNTKAQTRNCTPCLGYRGSESRREAATPSARVYVLPVGTNRETDNAAWRVNRRRNVRIDHVRSKQTDPNITLHCASSEINFFPIMFQYIYLSMYYLIKEDLRTRCKPFHRRTVYLHKVNDII